MSSWVKKLLHRHKYVTLSIYPPQCGLEYCFLLRCECGHVKSLRLYNIRTVEYVQSPPKKVYALKEIKEVKDGLS